MKSITITHAGIEENMIVRDGERLAVCTISVPISVPHTAHTEILIHVYTEALKAGAGALSREKFLDAESLLGAHIQVSGDSRNVRFSINSLDTTLTATLKLFETMLTKPLFAAPEIKRIKELLTNSLILSKEDAKTRAYEGFVNTLVDSADSRYVCAIDDLIQAIGTVTVGDLKKFHQSLFESTWILTSAGSPTSSKHIVKSVKKVHAGAKNASAKTTASIPFKERTKRTVLLTDIPHKQNIEFSIGNTLPLTRSDDAYAAFGFGMSVLALYGGFSGRLMSTVREKEGLTYSIYGQIEKATMTEQGFWRIATFFSPKDAEKGILATLRELSLIREKGITTDELNRFKAIMNTRATLVNDSLFKKVREIQGLRESAISDDAYRAFREKLQKMTVKEVNDALKKYLNLETLVISGAGPVQSITKVLTKFQK